MFTWFFFVFLLLFGVFKYEYVGTKQNKKQNKRTHTHTHTVFWMFKTLIFPKAFNKIGANGLMFKKAVKSIEYMKGLLIKYAQNTNHPRYNKLIEYCYFVRVTNMDLVLNCAACRFLFGGIKLPFHKMLIHMF